MSRVEEAFETFRQRLELSESERQDTIKRHTQVRACIRAAFGLDRDFLTGSYARHTKTKPLKDVDVFFVLDKSERWRRDKPPAEVLNAFLKQLGKEFGEENVKPGRRCATVKFDKKNPTADDAGKVLSIDCVPAFEHRDGYEIPDRDRGDWIKSDPEIHKEEATAKNAECEGGWVPAVKMLKAWNREAGKPLKPMFLVEVMAQKLIDPPFRSYPSEVRRFFAAATEGVMQDWADPAGLGPPVSDQMTPDMRRAASSLLRQAEQKAALAARLEAQGRSSEAIALWRELMGKYFPGS